MTFNTSNNIVNQIKLNSPSFPSLRIERDDFSKGEIRVSKIIEHDISIVRLLKSMNFYSVDFLKIVASIVC